MITDFSPYSPVIDLWVLEAIAWVPAEIRADPRWLALLQKIPSIEPSLEFEERAVRILYQHLRDVAVPLIQPVAERDGFGVGWSCLVERWSVSSVANIPRQVLKRSDMADVRYVVKGLSRLVGTYARPGLPITPSREVVRILTTMPVHITRAVGETRIPAWLLLDPLNLLQELVS